MHLESSIAAVISGGASGFGAATARRLAARGVRVALFNLAVDRARRSRAIGGLSCQVDATSDEQGDAAFSRARAAYGQERVLVNCAGTGNAVKTAWRLKETRAPRLAGFLPTNGDLNGESVRIGGALRMAPR